MAKQPSDRGDCLNKSELKARGWTDSLIGRFLGDPDRQVPNPRGRSGSEIKLFLRTRVEAQEASVEFQQAKSISTLRSQAGRKRSIEKQAELLKRIEKISFSVPEMEWEELIRRACENYNALHNGDSHFVQATPNSASEFLDRICVNYLRHVLSTYEREMAAVAGKVGANEARYLIRGRIVDAISDTYPELGSACNDQLKRYNSDWT